MFSQVDNLVLARVATRFLLLLSIFCVLLSGCASSTVARHAASSVDLGVENAKSLAKVTLESNIADTYQNLSQTTKGAILGASAGAIAGAYTSGVGVLAGAATGLVLGASYGAYVDANVNLLDRIKNRGVNVIVIGDQILIVIPSGRIFQPGGAQLRPEAFSTLSLITQYINLFTKMLVKIAAYTNDTGSERVDISLSEQQAQSLARYFLHDGIDARILYAVGYGGTRLVSSNTLCWEGSDNYRIEITLEKMYPYPEARGEDVLPAGDP